MDGIANVNKFDDSIPKLSLPTSFFYQRLETALSRL